MKNRVKFSLKFAMSDANNVSPYSSLADALAMHAFRDILCFVYVFCAHGCIVHRC